MRHLLTHQYIVPSLLALAAIALTLLLFLPPEQMLGHIIKIVFLHGALVQTGLLTFAAAGIVGLGYLVSRHEPVDAWCLAAQKTGVVVWSLY